MQARPSAQTQFRPDIEGLRAVAVMAVVLFHAGVPHVVGGFVGVDVFFVISGFLITGLLWREVSSSGTVRLSRFYGARARRLLPASAAVGVVTVIASAVLLPPLQVLDVIDDGIACALYVGNMWFVVQSNDYFANDQSASPFLHYWSLGVEEQFYLVWPPMIIGTALLVRFVRRRTAAHGTLSKLPYLVVLVLVAAVSFAVSLSGHPHVAFCGVLLDAHPGVAAGCGRPDRSDSQPVAPSTGTACLDRGLGRSGGDPADLHPVGHDHALSGYRRAAARARRRAGNRRGLCRACARSRACAGVAADAGDRAGVVLVVSMALAGAGACSAVGGPPAGAGREAGDGRHLRRAGCADTALHRKPSYDLPLPYAGRAAAVSRSAVPPRRSRSACV